MLKLISKNLLYDFFKLAYPHRYTNLIEHWKWFYRLGYNDYEPIVIEVDSRIIGMAGLIPSKLRCNEKILEDKFIELLNDKEKRFRTISYAWEKVNEIHSFSNVKNIITQIKKELDEN